MDSSHGISLTGSFGARTSCQEWAEVKVWHAFGTLITSLLWEMEEGRPTDGSCPGGPGGPGIADPPWFPRVMKGS